MNETIIYHTLIWNEHTSSATSLYVVVPFSSTFSQTFILKWRNPLLVEYGFCKAGFGAAFFLREEEDDDGAACFLFDDDDDDDVALVIGDDRICGGKIFDGTCCTWLDDEVKRPVFDFFGGGGPSGENIGWWLNWWLYCGAANNCCCWPWTTFLDDDFLVDDTILMKNKLRGDAMIREFMSTVACGLFSMVHVNQ